MLQEDKDNACFSGNLVPRVSLLPFLGAVQGREEDRPWGRVVLVGDDQHRGILSARARL